MLTKKKSRFVLLLALILTVALSFSSCAFFMDALAKDELEACDTFFDYVQRNSYAAAYDTVKYFTTPETFESFWVEARAVLAGAESYTLSAKEWSSFVDNGNSYTEALILLTTDIGTSTLVYTVVLDGEWLCGMQVLDVTDFVTATSWVPTANLLLVLLSLLGFAFSIWMFIDALVRRIKLKALWAILTLVNLGGGFTLGAATAKMAFNLLFFYPHSVAAIDYGSLAVSVRVLLPVGAIVYFFLRRRLTRKETPVPAVTPIDISIGMPGEAPAATVEPPTDSPAAPADTPAAPAGTPVSEETKSE